MYVELNEKQIKFVKDGNGNGVHGAMCDTQANGGDGLHLYTAFVFGHQSMWLCSSQPLTEAEISEAVALYEGETNEREATQQALIKNLLAPDGEQIILEAQNGHSDKQTANREICKALGLWKPYKQNPSWGAVKERRAALLALATAKIGNHDVEYSVSLSVKLDDCEIEIAGVPDDVIAALKKVETIRDGDFYLNRLSGVDSSNQDLTFEVETIAALDTDVLIKLVQDEKANALVRTTL